MMRPSRTDSRRKAFWGRTALVFLLFGAAATSALAAGAHSRVASRASRNAPNAFVNLDKLDRELSARARSSSNDTTSVIVTFVNGELPANFKPFVKDSRSRLGIINGYAMEVPNRLLNTLAASPDVVQFHVDRPLYKQNLRTAVTTGSRALQQALGITGPGGGVAGIRSGHATGHDGPP